jgi:hypothetical protein
LDCGSHSQSSMISSKPRKLGASAQKKRAAAEGMRDPAARRKMIGVATWYERLAERALGRARTGPESDAWLLNASCFAIPGKLRDHLQNISSFKSIAYHRHLQLPGRLTRTRRIRRQKAHYMRSGVRRSCKPGPPPRGAARSAIATARGSFRSAPGR